MRSPSTLLRLCLLAALGSATAACGLLKRRPAPPPEVTTARYVAFTAQYRGVSIGETRQFFDDQATLTRFAFQYYLRADVVGNGDGLAATLVLDSIVLQEGASGGVSPEQVDSARGATFQAELAATGRLADFHAAHPSGSLATEVADRVLKTFFPLIPEAGATAGASWADTADTQLLANGLQHSMHVSSQHTATGWTDHAGERALLIRTFSVYDFSGSGSQSGRAFTLSGDGRRHLLRYIGEDGRYLGLVAADTSTGEARLTHLDIVIPIHQTRIDSLAIR